MACRLLIVEDNQRLRTRLCEWLQSEFPDCVIMEAADGEAAVASAREHKFDVILMDIELPGMDGIEATRQVKHVRTNGYVPKVVTLTIHDEEAFREDAAAAGSNAYVSKSNMHTELIPVLAQFLQASEISQDS